MLHLNSLFFFKIILKKLYQYIEVLMEIVFLCFNMNFNFNILKNINKLDKIL